MAKKAPSCSRNMCYIHQQHQDNARLSLLYILFHWLLITLDTICFLADFVSVYFKSLGKSTCRSFNTQVTIISPTCSLALLSKVSRLPPALRKLLFVEDPCNSAYHAVIKKFCVLLAAAGEIRVLFGQLRHTECSS